MTAIETAPRLAEPQWPSAEPQPAPTAPASDPRTAFADYELYLDKAQAAYERGDLESAGVYAAVAAHVAMRPHAGFFVSPRLERLLTDIGRDTATPTLFQRKHNPTIRHLLHVVTEVTPVGGLTNMLTRWIQCDTAHVHSLALTSQRTPILASVEDAVIKSGGQVYRLNARMGGQIRWAQELRMLARRHDAVVQHVYGQDVIPTIAFAEPATLPPIMLLNHGDHLFWLGVSTSDVVINLRDEAQTLSIARRRVEPRRNVMAPTIVAPAVRSRSRAQAKAELGLAPDAVLMLSAARGMKYRTVGRRSFADTHVELLKRHPNAVLWVLGPGEPEDWREACAAVGGRIKGFEETPDTKVHFEAADIAVDSFPFVSSTSLMESAGLGTPLVSRFYGPREARIFAINHPGIDKPTLHGATEDEYLAHLDRLIADPDLRARKGEEARLSVLHYHTPPSWLDFIERAYELAAQLPPIKTDGYFGPEETENFAEGEPDRSLFEVFGYAQENPLRTAKAYLGRLPAGERLRTWREAMRAGVFDSRGEALRALAPDWLRNMIKESLRP
ncbi:MAG TPA: hypothetical protein VG841_11640 [Caulobacterales bacterium]|nr:hypothetical protein [Caulobacterales bacterium]